MTGRSLPLRSPYNLEVSGCSEQVPPQNDPRIYFAAERTFLAWIRTGLGLMGVGFAVARFGLFLRQAEASEAGVLPQSTGLSRWSGVGLVALGVAVNISAIVKHVQLIRQLSSGSWRAGRVSRDAILLAVVLAAIGVAMGAYLMLVR